MFEKENPGIKVDFDADCADGIQRRAQRQARGRHRRRHHHLPAVRRLAGRCSRRGQLADHHRPARHGELLRRRQGRLVDRRRQDDLLRADGLGDPRLHLQQGCLRQGRHQGSPTTEDEFYAALDKIKADGTYIAARHRHPRPVGSRDHGLPEHRPELLEGRGRPQGADRRQAEADRCRLGRAVQASSPSGSPISPTASRPQTYSDSQNLFTLGRAAIYPAGSWEISGFEQRTPTSRWARSRRRSRRPATSATSPTISIIGIGINAKSKTSDAAKKFMTWVASPRIRGALRQRAAGLLPPHQPRR